MQNHPKSKVGSFLVVLTLVGISLTCSNNCYLGGSFFSAPLDNRRCCREDLKDPNCEYYTQILQSVICFRCILGFQWSNNECVPFGQVEEDQQGKLLSMSI